MKSSRALPNIQNYSLSSTIWACAGMTVMQVMGCGIQKGTKEFAIKENAEIALLPKQQINLVVETKDVDNIVEKVKQVLYTGHIGDGKIFVYSIDNVIKVRTGDEGIDAL